MKKYAWIYIIITILVAVWVVRYFTNRPVRTEIACAVSYEDKVEAAGVLVRYETVYRSDTGGSLQPSVTNETRVAKGKKIASVYTDGIDGNLKIELNNINEKIEKLENSTRQADVFGSDVAALETRVKTGIDELVDLSISHEMSQLPIISKEIAKLIQTQQEVSGADSPRQNALKDLYVQRQQTEEKIQSAKRDIYSSASGVYIGGVDGYEAFLTPEAVMQMGAEEFNALSIPKRSTAKDHYGAGEEVCKTVDNGIWYIALSLPSDAAESVKNADKARTAQGMTLYLRLPELSSAAVPARLESVSDEENGNVLLVLSSRNYIKGVYSERSVKAEIIKGDYDGLKIPVGVLRVIDGETGVFVNTDGVSRFRKVDVIYTDDTIAIVNKSNENGYLKLYDPVIVESKDIEQGKIVN